jgi:hypothetical protein
MHFKWFRAVIRGSQYSLSGFRLRGGPNSRGAKGNPNHGPKWWNYWFLLYFFKMFYTNGGETCRKR